MLVSGAEVDIRNIMMKMADKVSRQVNFLVCNICWMIWTLTRHYNVLHVLTLFPTKLECGPMPNLMVALPNIGGALCSTPQSLADAHY